jgi:hypothetical protein
MTTQEVDKLVKDTLKGIEVIDKSAYNKSVWGIAGAIARLDEPVTRKKLTDTERRELIVRILDGKAVNGEITPQEMDRYIDLCGLGKNTQDIVIEEVDFREAYENPTTGD